MDLTHLEWFCAVAVSQNVTRTAQELHITPPTLSRAIGSLESDLGCRLFDRVNGRMRLNESGQRLLLHTRRALAELNEGFSAARSDESAESRLRAVVNCEILRDMLFYHIRCGGGALPVRMHHMPEALDLLHARQADFGVLRGAPERDTLDWEPLMRERIYVMVGREQVDRLFPQRQIRLRQLRDLDLLMSREKTDFTLWMESLCAAEGVRLKNSYEMGANDSFIDDLLNMRPAGLLCSTFSLLTVMDAKGGDAAIVPVLIDDPSCASQIYLVRRRAGKPNAAARGAMDDVRAYFAQLTAVPDS